MSYYIYESCKPKSCEPCKPKYNSCQPCQPKYKSCESSKYMKHNDCTKYCSHSELSTLSKLPKLPELPKLNIVIQDPLPAEEYGNPCIMCMTNTSDVVFNPCSHIIMCTHCAELWRNAQSNGFKCPTCKTTINFTITLKKFNFNKNNQDDQNNQDNQNNQNNKDNQNNQNNQDDQNNKNDNIEIVIDI